MNKKIFSVSVIVIIIITVIVTSIIYFVNANKDDDKHLSEKTEQELKYIEREIISMMNHLNNISFTDSVLKQTTKESTNSSNEQTNKNEQSTITRENNQDGTNSEASTKTVKFTTEVQGILETDLSYVDWEYLKTNIENLYDIWSIAIVDLHSLNVNNEDILNFSILLDKVTINIKDEDKLASLNNLANLYSYISLYFEQISDNNKNINIQKTKSAILNSYVFVEQNNWNEVQLQLQEAINYYTNVINNVDEGNKNNKNKITKIYVLLNELNNATSLQSKEIYYIKYKNVMDELVNI